MGPQYHREILSSGSLKLMVNYGGIGTDDVVNASDLVLHIYAYDEVTFQQVFAETLSIEQIRVLYTLLNQISVVRDGEREKTGKFIEVKEDLIDLLDKIEKCDSGILKAILSKIGAHEKLGAIIDSLSEEELNNLDATIKQTIHKNSLQDLSLLLQLEKEAKIVEEIEKYSQLEKYAAKQPEKIFQNWIEQNLWALGVDYVKKHDARKIGINAESDLLMETTDGFIDLIELKRPNSELLKFDESHKSYYPSQDLSKVIGQCLLYLEILDTYKLILEKDYKVKVIKPRVKIITGRTLDFNDDQHKALRLLNSNLNHIQIISYDYLFNSGYNIVSHYSIDVEDKVAATCFI